MAKACVARQRAGVRNAPAAWVLPLAVVLSFPAAAHADLVRFSTGRTISVESVTMSGDTAVLVLRGGGQVEMARSDIAEILPDEYVREKPQAASTPAPVVAQGDAGVLHALVVRVAERHGVDAPLAHAVVTVESNYRPNAVSSKGAMGLMQIMPVIAREYAVANPFDPEANLSAGLKHLRGLLDRFDVRTALAAYNAGAGAVARYGGIPPFPETREYVERVLTLARRP